MYSRQVDTFAIVAAAAALILPQSSEKWLATMKGKQDDKAYKVGGIGQVVGPHLPVKWYKPSGRAKSANQVVHAKWKGHVYQSSGISEMEGSKSSKQVV